jgi:hypothetical protein
LQEQSGMSHGARGDLAYHSIKEYWRAQTCRR